jgi:hypothetical protein
LKLGELLDGSNAVKVVWVKAHVTVELQQVLEVEPRILTGNECADALAKRGAKTVAVLPGEEANLKWAPASHQEHGEDQEDRQARVKAHKARQEHNNNKKLERKRVQPDAAVQRARKWPRAEENDPGAILAQEESPPPALQERLLGAWKRRRAQKTTADDLDTAPERRPTRSQEEQHHRRRHRTSSPLCRNSTRTAVGRHRRLGTW